MALSINSAMPFRARISLIHAFLGVVSHLWSACLRQTRAACCCIGTLLCANALAADVGLLRGPYLQTATPSSIIIRWRTDVATESIILYGTNSENLHLLSGDIEETTEHEVAIDGLSPGTKYFYAIGTFSEMLAGGADYFFFT